MNGLVSSWRHEDEFAVEAELEKLFLLQDRALSKEKKTVFVGELSHSGLPAKAVIAGIKKLQAEDMRTVKVVSILDASREFTERDPDDGRSRCEDCEGRATITMRDEGGQYFSLACRCEAGARTALKKRFAAWNGEKIQFIKTRRLERV